MGPSKAVLLVLSTSLALLAVTTAQDRRAEVLRPPVPVRIDARTQRSDLIVVKFREGHAVRLDAEGRLTCPTLDLTGPRARIGDRGLERVFTRAIADLERERRVLEASSGMRLADLDNYYFVHTRGPRDGEALLTDLLAEPAIETAYPEPGTGGIVPLPDIPPTTPLFESQQTYFGPAPPGFGHLWTRNIDGAQGLATQIVAQLEGAWIMGHEDAENLIASNVIGTTSFGSYNTSSWLEHGTACFGILNAGRNLYGTVGFAPLAAGRVCSLANGSPNLISLATAAATAGDVFTSSFAYVINSKHAPADYFQANFDAVKTATAKGICYTFSAGNTGADLADAQTYGTRYAPSAPESGGFIIGATGAGDLDRASWSNYGVKVIANGWGSGIATLGYGALFQYGTDGRQSYTAGFGGTSGAAPLVAGVIASLQGASMRQNGAPLAPAQVRALLTVHGTAVTGSIGLRPDLAALMAAAKVLDGLRVTTEPEIGKSLGFEVAASANRLYVVLGSAARGDIALGLNRRVLLDLASLFVLQSGVIGSSGTANLQLPIPNDAALRTQSFFLQVLDMSAGLTGLHLSNSIEAWVR